MSAHLVALGMGSNRPPTDVAPFDRPIAADPRARALIGAVRRLGDAGIATLAASVAYWTTPVGVSEHDDYLNACLLVAGGGDLLELLDTCERVEREAGRLGKGDLAPRPLDLDLLAAWLPPRPGGRTPEPVAISTRRLKLPHPRLLERPFALEPLGDIAGPLPLPGPDPELTVERAAERARSRRGSADSVRRAGAEAPFPGPATVRAPDGHPWGPLLSFGRAPR